MSTFTYNELIQALQGEAAAEGEILLPDYCPSIMKIVGVEAQPFLRAQSVRGDRVYADGNVEFRVVYTSDSAEGIQEVTHRMPFSYSAQIHNENESSQVTVRAGVTYKNARALSPQKLYAKATVEIATDVYAPTLIEMLETEKKSRAEVLEKNVRISDMTASAVKTLRMKEEIDFGKTDISKMLRYDAEFCETDKKYVNSKMIVKADMLLKIVYVDGDGKICVYENRIPVSQVMEIPGLDENTDCSVSFSLADMILTAQKNGDNTSVGCEAEINITAECSKSKEIGIVTDAFSVSDSAECVKKTVRFQDRIRVAEPLEFKSALSVDDAEEIFDVSVHPGIMSVSCDTGKAAAISQGVFACSVLYRNSEGGICAAEKAVPFTIETAVGSNTSSVRSNCRLVITSMSYSFSPGADVEIRINALHVGTMITDITDSSVVDINFSPSQTSKRAEMTVYYAQAGDSVWDIAKKFRASVSKIMSRNKLSEDVLTAPRMIFIA